MMCVKKQNNRQVQLYEKTRKTISVLLDIPSFTLRMPTNGTYGQLKRSSGLSNPNHTATCWSTGWSEPGIGPRVDSRINYRKWSRQKTCSWYWSDSSFLSREVNGFRWLQPLLCQLSNRRWPPTLDYRYCFHRDVVSSTWRNNEARNEVSTVVEQDKLIQD